MSATDRVRLLITSGRGPVECQRAVMRLASILEAEARAGGLRVGRGPVEAGDVGAAARPTRRPPARASASRIDASRMTCLLYTSDAADE